MGGNAAGKTTLLDTLSEKHRYRGNIAWLHGDGGFFGGNTADQFKALMRFWNDPMFETIVLEGTRVYSTVFRCSTHARQPRDLYLALMLQSYDDGIHHLKLRCERKGKAYRSDFWGRGNEEVGHLFHDRYTKGLRKFQREQPGAPIKAAEIFWIDRDYQAIAQVEAWADRVLQS